MRRLLRLFPLKPVRCPCCRLRIDGQHVWFLRNCAACGTLFKIRRRYVLATYVPALLASTGIAFAVGNRGAALLSLAGLLLLPTFWGMLMINVRLFPPDIEVVREGWTPGDSDGDRALEQEFELLRELDPVIGWEEPETSRTVFDESADDPRGRLPLSTPKDPPLTFEGIVIAVAVTALIAYHVYVALEPHL